MLDQLHEAKQMKMTSTKAHYAAGGGVLGSALAQILVWIGAQSGIDMSTIEIPLGMVITGIAAWCVTYAAPANKVIP